MQLIPPLDTRMSDGSTLTDDALAKEVVYLQRRYHGKVAAQDEAAGVTVRCFMALSDKDLPPELKGESELLVTFPVKYPTEPAHVDLSSWENRVTSDQFVAVNEALAVRAQELMGSYAIRKLLTWLDNHLYQILQASAPLEAQTGGQEAEEEQKEEESGPVDPRSKKLCRFYVRSKCSRGDQCKYLHEKPKSDKKKKKKKAKKPAGESEGGDGEKDEKTREPSPVKSHEPTNVVTTQSETTEKSAAPAAKIKPKRERKRPCKFFAKGACRDGEKCKFSHQQKSVKFVLSDEKPVKRGIIIATIGDAPSSPPSAPVDAPPSPPPIPEVPQVKLPSPEDWTAEQQQALDMALKKYPATMEKKERWISIASEVEGKLLNDCIDRFKLLSQLIKIGAPIPTIPTPPLQPTTDLVDLVQQTVETEADREEAEDESEVTPIHAKIIPEDKRVPIQTEPEVKGAQIRLDDLFLYQIGTVVPHCLVCQVQCTQCPLKFDAKLSLDNAAIRKWCPRCSSKHIVELRPTFTHAQSNVLAYIDTENCAVVDVLPSDLLASCLECGKEALLEGVVPGRRSEQACFACHTKVALMTKQFAIGNITIGKKNAEAKEKRVVENFVLGQPLPRNGACDHYKHSLRWFRFQCCGKAFPCDVCHDASDCEEANTGKVASKIICGLCSKEQSSSVKECSCGNEMGRKANRSRHWEGGHGCRDQTRMSSNDKQKFRGQNKTGSQKHKRVGVIGKLRTLRTAERTNT